MYRDAVAGFQYDQPDSEGAIANKQLDGFADRRTTGYERQP
jgi:hypothetical protein